MKLFKIFLSALFLCTLTLWSCSGNKTDDSKKSGVDSAQTNTTGQPEYEPDSMPAYKLSKEFKESEWGDAIAPPKLDLAQDVSALSMEELEYLRCFIYARKGHMTLDATERARFNSAQWYQPVYWDENFRVSFTAEEQNLLDRIATQQKERSLKNFPNQSGNIVAVENVINLFQYKKETLAQIDPMLSTHGFALVPTKNEQLFYSYDQQNYSYQPPFVTTDLFLQTFHMYFSYLLRNLEEEKFTKIFGTLAEGMYGESLKLASSEDAIVKEAAEFNVAYWGIARELLTGKKTAIPSKLQSAYQTEITFIRDAKGKGSLLLNDESFDHSLFKPRGHYTRSETLSNYFKALLWVQTAPLAYDAFAPFGGALLDAWMLKNVKTASGESLAQVYASLYEPITFLVGEPNRESVFNVLEMMNKNLLPNEVEALLSIETQKKAKEALSKLKLRKFKAKTSDAETEEVVNRLVVNFLPQRYTFDAEILARMVEVERPNVKLPARRQIPKGLDVFAATGNATAESILLNQYKEAIAWPAYDDTLAVLKSKFGNEKNWSAINSVYKNWMVALKLVQQGKGAGYPYFMNAPGWQLKSLNTSLASWSELKHDVILYAEQPNAAEMGSGFSLPDPEQIGYVEPNVPFWKFSRTMLESTQAVLNKFNLLTGSIGEKTEALVKFVSQLETISIKEIAGTEVSRDEYEFLCSIGGEVEHLTLNIMDAGNWYSVSGPDKSMAVVADVYTYNGFTEQKVLEEAVGNANEIYVIVPHKGKLYLMKGAAFSHYEFTVSPSERMTDEEWQEKINKGLTPPPAIWMNEILVEVPEKSN